jgi:hypothetical protein
MLSISYSGSPPVEHITGFFVLAITSSNGQSLAQQLAILMIWMP